MKWSFGVRKEKNNRFGRYCSDSVKREGEKKSGVIDIEEESE